MTSLALQLADWARSSEQLLQTSLAHPGPLTLALVFGGGLLTSLGPCSLSLLPVTLAYLAGFSAQENPAAAGALPCEYGPAADPLDWGCFVSCQGCGGESVGGGDGAQ